MVGKNVAAGAADASRAMLLTSCGKVELLTAIFAFFDFPKPSKINSLQTKKDSIPIAVRSGPAISPHPPQPPAASFKRLYRTREEHFAGLLAFVKTRLR
jgi:hypothetical protein